MVVFGGYDGTSRRNDVWALSLAGNPAWSALCPHGEPAVRRVTRHTAIYDPVRDRMVVFGGAAPRPPQRRMGAVAGGEPGLERACPDGGPPSARSDTRRSTTRYATAWWCSADTDGTSHLNDVWALSLAGSPAWSALAPTGSPPSARNAHTAIYDPVRDRMVVLGDIDVPSNRNDVWDLSLAGSPAWSALTPAGSPPSARYGTHGDLRRGARPHGGVRGTRQQRGAGAVARGESGLSELTPPRGVRPLRAGSTRRSTTRCATMIGVRGILQRQPPQRPVGAVVGGRIDRRSRLARQRGRASRPRPAGLVRVRHGQPRRQAIPPHGRRVSGRSSTGSRPTAPATCATRTRR